MAKTVRLDLRGAAVKKRDFENKGKACADKDLTMVHF